MTGEPELDVATTLVRWKADLNERIRRRLLIGELVDSEADTSDLIIEAEQLKRVVRALKWGEK